MSKEKLLINDPKSNNSGDMSNKQIEEIDELEMVLYEANHKKSVLDYRWLATEAYNAGYRKQSEGEWIDNDDMYTADMLNYRCSICGNHEYTPRNFCSKCGAKMKGGE